MDIVRFKGGLGNQMFQYAFMQALRSRGREVYANLGFYRRHTDLMGFELDKVFKNITLPEVPDAIFENYNYKWREIKKDEILLETFLKDYKNRFFYIEEKDGVYDSHVFATNACVYVGYWQSEKYFENIKDVLHRDFEFAVKDSNISDLGNKLNKHYYSVHVRRGDYLDNTELYGGICTQDYYKRAFDVVRDYDAEAKFIFFSDDIQWTKQVFGEKGFIISDMWKEDSYCDWYDMYLMTRCAGNIIANSSFSWWGAWLNCNPTKIVIAPKRWINGKETRDIYCGGWIKL